MPSPAETSSRMPLPKAAQNGPEQQKTPESVTNSRRWSGKGKEQKASRRKTAGPADGQTSRYKEENNRKEHLENEFILLKQQVDNEFKEQKERELKRELLMENKEFLKYFFTEERSILNCHPSDTSVMLNMDNSRDLDMDVLIKNIDSWYHNIAQRSKEEANLFYQNQIEDLQNKKCQCHESLQKNSDEITELNRLVHLMQSKLDTEKKKTAALQIAIGDIEHKGDHALKDARAKQTELQNRIQNSKDQLAVILRDYQDLMNTKLALDIEIATYNTMLVGEENRIRTGETVRMAVTKATYPLHNMHH